MALLPAAVWSLSDALLALGLELAAQPTLSVIKDPTWATKPLG
jgi:hypothetical protein